MSDVWRSVASILTEARTAIANVESGTETSEYDVKMVRTRLDEARTVIEAEDDVPTETLETHVESLETELETARKNSCLEEAKEWLNNAEESILAATEALEAGDYESACERFLTAKEVLETRDDVIDGLEGNTQARAEVADRWSSVRDRTETFAEEYLADAATECKRASTADDPETAIAAWTEADERYRSALAAGWDGPGSVSEAGLKYQQAWVAASKLDALVRYARTLERRGDDADDDDTAREFYEEAIDVLEQACDFSETQSHHSTTEYQDDRERVTEKALSKTEWTWGSTETES